jgi:tRNA pseudouridine55 synthase
MFQGDFMENSRSKSSRPQSVALKSGAIGAVAVGAFAVGALSVGALAIGALAIGRLVIGRATRLAQFYTRRDKVYEATIRFGFPTDTYDRAGVPTAPEAPVPPLSPEFLEPYLQRFRGKFLQTPPAVSAKKIGGRPAYELARKKVAVEIAPVEVQFYELTLLAVEGSDIRVRAFCSAGAYLRGIAHDLGREIGCGAHLYQLRRTEAGDFTLDRASTLDRLAELKEAGRLQDALIPAAELLPEFPDEFVDEITEAHIRQGRDFAVSPFRVHKDSHYVKAISRSGALVAIGEIRLPNLYHPMLVL